MAYKAYKYRIYPNKNQMMLINKTFGCVRFIYNNLLADRTDYYNKHKKKLKREITYYKNNPDYAFLKEVDSLALANAKLNLETAYKNFFEHKSSFPKFHKKGINDSYTTNNQQTSKGYTIEILNNYIKLPKLGFIKVKQHRLIGNGETIKSCTISRIANKYYISVLVEYEDNIDFENPLDITLDNTIGLDYSSTHFYIDSNGKSAEYPRYYRQAEAKLAKAQRRLSKMVKGSNNYNKQKIKVQKLHQKVANQRYDFAHKLSNQITNDYKLICFEDINLSNIKRCLKLGKSTSDNGFGMFRTFCEYKANKKGHYTIKIDKWFPSTKTCNHCGCKNSEIILSTKEWKCPNCGVINQRDSNAALNIKNEGYRLFMAV